MSKTCKAYGVRYTAFRIIHSILLLYIWEFNLIEFHVNFPCERLVNDSFFPLTLTLFLFYAYTLLHTGYIIGSRKLSTSKSIQKFPFCCILLFFFFVLTPAFGYTGRIYGRRARTDFSLLSCIRFEMKKSFHSVQCIHFERNIICTLLILHPNI